MPRQQSIPNDLPRLWTGAQLMQALGIHRKHPAQFLHRLRRNGLIRGIRIGNDIKYPECEVRRLLNGEVNAA